MADVGLVRTAYSDLSAVLGALTPEDGRQPTGCAGWSVLDLAFHLLNDTYRALVALSTPAEGPPVVDAVGYWRPDTPPSGEDADGAEAVRIAAAVQGGIAVLARRFAASSAAVLVAADRVPAGEPVANQGAPMTLPDLLSTLVVEATVHHLDLVRYLDRPGPAAGPLAHVRQVFEGLLGRPLGEPLSAAERAELGPLADRFSLLG
jgi:uncharacterized protein (TIGR03083 family)